MNNNVMADIKEILATIKAEIVTACQRTGRDPEEVKLVAVSKSFPAEAVQKVYDCGQRVFGENRVQELLRKMEVLPADIEWHLIGSLQRNKVKDVVGKAALIHSVDSLGLAQEISKHASRKNLAVNVLLQVNVSGEESKHGFTPEELCRDVEEISQLAGIKIKGLMTIAPLAENPEECRPVFRQLQQLAWKLETKGYPGAKWLELSMGMSDDFCVAVEEGATMVRIGSRIFGARQYL